MKRILLTWIAAIFILTSCEDNNTDPSNNSDNKNNISVSASITGIYSGSGKYMPQGINLGTFEGCVVPPGWEKNLLSGSALVNISIVTDSTVNITLSGGPFSTIKYTNVKATKVANSIDLNSGYIGYFDLDSKFLNLSISTGSYIKTNACLQGLPYYAGWSVLSDGNYSYQTIGHIDFAGNKQ